MQRDLPGWGLPARPQVTDRLLRMLAVSHGQTWNASRIGASLGLSHGTVSHYLDYLEGAFLVRRLAPLHANLGKRLTKTPKIFWRDTGLLHGLLGVTSVDDLLGQPWVGASWEGFVIEQVIGALRAAGSDAQVFFFRTSDGYEIDLVIEGHKERWAVEIKLTTRPAPEDLARLERTAAMIGANRHFLVSQTPESIDNGKSASCSLDWILGRLVELK